MIAKRCILFLLLAGFCFLAACGRAPESGTEDRELPSLTIGHVGHDHHLALFVAADHGAEFAKESGVELRMQQDQKLYGLFVDGAKVAEVEIVRVGGGSKMPTALAQAVIDIGLGGTAPVLAAIDKGGPLKLISPLHNKGDMLVVRPDLQIHSWDGFVDYVRNADQPVRVGYKSPMAVAKIVFEDALAHAGLEFSGDLSDTEVDVHLVNVKGGGKLNVALSQGLVLAYAGNNPFAAIAQDKGIGKVLCELESLPPGRFENHPCCCVAANAAVLADHPEEVAAVLTALRQATDLINRDLQSAAACGARWIGTSREVELASIPTSGYAMDDSQRWHSEMSVWLEAMNALGLFKGSLKGLDEQDVAGIAYDLKPLHEACSRLEQY